MFPVSVLCCAFFPHLCPKFLTFVPIRHPREGGDDEKRDCVETR